MAGLDRGLGRLWLSSANVLEPVISLLYSNIVLTSTLPHMSQESALQSCCGVTTDVQVSGRTGSPLSIRLLVAYGQGGRNEDGGPARIANKASSPPSQSHASPSRRKMVSFRALVGCQRNFRRLVFGWDSLAVSSTTNSDRGMQCIGPNS
jgi:hypothetical protein